MGGSVEEKIVFEMIFCKSRFLLHTAEIWRANNVWRRWIINGLEKWLKKLICSTLEVESKIDVKWWLTHVSIFSEKSNGNNNFSIVNIIRSIFDKLHVRQFTQSFTHYNMHTIFYVIPINKTMLNKISVGPIFRIVYDARSSNIICTAEWCIRFVLNCISHECSVLFLIVSSAVSL